MGYFSNIIKDSHASMAFGRRSVPAPPVSNRDLDAASQETPSMRDSAIDTKTDRQTSDAQAPGDAPAAVVPKKSVTASAMREEPATVSTVPVANTRPRRKRMQAAARIQPGGPSHSPEDEPADGKVASATAQPPETAAPVQRKATASVPAPATVRPQRNRTGPRQPDSPVQQRASLNPGQDLPAKPSRRFTLDGTALSTGPAARRETGPRTGRWRTTVDADRPEIRDDTFAGDPEVARHVAQSAYSGRQQSPVTVANARFNATEKPGNIQPGQTASPMAAAPKSPGVSSEAVVRDDSPRVRIGQVNVIVEESQASSNAPSRPAPTEDAASRMFLRSL